MKRSTRARYSWVSAILAAVISIAAGSGAAEITYVGAKKCKMCHNSSKAGKQYTIWSASAHSKAFANLAEEPALKSCKGERH